MKSFRILPVLIAAQVCTLAGLGIASRARDGGQSLLCWGLTLSLLAFHFLTLKQTEVSLGCLLGASLGAGLLLSTTGIQAGGWIVYSGVALLLWLVIEALSSQAVGGGWRWLCIRLLVIYGLGWIVVDLLAPPLVWAQYWGGFGIVAILLAMRIRAGERLHTIAEGVGAMCLLTFNLALALASAFGSG